MDDSSCEGTPHRHPEAAASHDPEVLREALIRESYGRARAECRAHMQAEVVNLALDLLVREPDIDGFFGALTKAMVEESESHTCGVWLIDESGQRCELWMVYAKDRLYAPHKDDWDNSVEPGKRVGVSRSFRGSRAVMKSCEKFFCRDRIFAGVQRGASQRFHSHEHGCIRS